MIVPQVRLSPCANQAKNKQSRWWWCISTEASWMLQVVRTSESTRWYSQHCPKRTCCINPKRCCFPTAVRAWFLAVRSKHAVLWFSTEGSLRLPKKHSQVPIQDFFLKIRKISAASQARLWGEKKKICFYYKYIFKIQYFLLAGFLNDDSNLFSDFSYAEKKVSIAKIRLHESLHQSFYVQKHIKGLQGV